MPSPSIATKTTESSKSIVASKTVSVETKAVNPLDVKAVKDETIADGKSTLIAADAKLRQGRMPSVLVAISRTNFPLIRQKIFASLMYAVTTGEAKQPKYDERNVVDNIVVNIGIQYDWSVELKWLRELSKFNSHNHGYFKEAVNGLKGQMVRIDIFAKDNEPICPSCKIYLTKTNQNRYVCSSCGYETDGKGISKKTHHGADQSLFSRIEATNDGKVYFTFDKFIQSCIDKRRIYCKFAPEIVNALNKNSSHAIYLLLSDYIDEKRGEGQTPFMDIETFAELVGGEKYLSNFKQLRIKSIEPAIDEINRETNITAFFDRYEDVKQSGRKITAIRIRGEYNKDYKDKGERQTRSLFDDDNEQNNTLTLFGYTIDKDSFLDFLSQDATNKSAYKHKVQISLDNGTLGDIKERVTKYLSFKEEQEKIIEAEKQNKKANEFYKRLLDIAVREKQSKIEELTVFTENYGFVSVNRFIDDNKLIELAEQLNGLSDWRISKRLYTTKEKKLYETKEYDLYQKTIIKPLIDIAPMDSWFVIIDGEETKMFYSAIIRAIGKTAILGTMRKIERLLKQGVNVEFRAERELYLGSFDDNHNLTLKLKSPKQRID